MLSCKLHTLMIQAHNVVPASTQEVAIAHKCFQAKIGHLIT
jgi:hypothetical protein